VVDFFLARFRRQERRRRRDRFNEAHIRNRLAWSPQIQIEDLGDPHGKRLLFEGQIEPTGWPSFVDKWLSRA